MPAIQEISAPETPLVVKEKKKKSKSIEKVVVEEIPKKKSKKSKKDEEVNSESPKKKKKKSKDEDEDTPKKEKKEKKNKDSKKRKVADVESPVKNTITGDDLQKKIKKTDETNEREEHEFQESEAVIVKDDADIYRNAHENKAPALESIPQHLRLTSHNLCSSTLAALEARGIKQLFPIQAASFSHIMSGKDLLGRARTGTGKTLAFSLPMVETLKKLKRENSSQFSRRGRAPRVLIMAPTRELAMQVHKEFDSISSGELKSICVYGGTPYQEQNWAFRDGLDVVVGTPGRLIDHVERGNLKLQDLLFICLDEADQMLDIGFADSMEKILQNVQQQKAAANSQRQQVLLFSATLPAWIRKAVENYMRPDKVTLDLIGNDKHKTSSTVKHYALPSRWQNRADVLGDIVSVYGRGGSGRTMVFVETKGEANELALHDKLVAIGVQALHGDIPQKQREIAMQGFRDGKYSCLIATNVCARGVDIPEVDLVINCEPPNDVESYIHRSGRTGRAGKSGVCVTFYKPNQEYQLQNIARRAGVEFNMIGAPQAKDIVTARAFECVQTIKTEVEETVFGYFNQTAEELLAHFDGDGIKALSAALAVICNTTKALPSRSLLSANEGFITLLFRVENPIRNVGYIKSITQKSYPGLTYEDTVGWRMTADQMGVIVDINEKKVQVVDHGDGQAPTIKLDGIPWVDCRGVSLEVAKEVPELQERFGGDMHQSSGRGRFGGNSRGGSRGGGSRGRGGSSYGGQRSYGGHSRGGRKY